MKKISAPIPTKQNLVDAALHYLERFAASEATLRRVLLNRLLRADRANPDFAADHARHNALRSDIETIIEAHKKAGILNDMIFADTKINSLRREGRSRRAIQQKLRTKGVSADIVASALRQHDGEEDPQEAEWQAALAWARRRKLGPFGRTPTDHARQRKDLAALARAGFSSDIARRVLKTDLAEEWE